jgi:hypothetical protein
VQDQCPQGIISRRWLRISNQPTDAGEVFPGIGTAKDSK